jgi:hypothetical protein
LTGISPNSEWPRRAACDLWWQRWAQAPFKPEDIWALQAAWLPSLDIAVQDRLLSVDAVARKLAHEGLASVLR